jgi:hypothetical protein
MMEMLSLISLVSSARDRRNPAARSWPDHHIFGQNRFSTDLSCAMLNHVSSRPLIFTLARLLCLSRL